MAPKKKSGILSDDECAYCSTTECDLKKCTRCRLVCYCSKACQTAHWKAQPFGHRDRCIAPKDRKPSVIQPKDAKDEPALSEVAEKDLCGVCFEPLLAENALQQSGAPHAGTQTLVCKHSFHLKCASNLAALSASPLCPLCRGPFSSIPTENLFLDTKDAYNVIETMVDNGQITWATLPPSVKIRMRSISRKFLEAANRGHAKAQATLGCMYCNGEGVRQDDKEAVKWFQQASDQGSAYAQFNLGVMYKSGRGVKQDLEEAVKWFQQSSDRGFAYAQFNLGVMYYKGQGIKQDSKEALKWFQHAADQRYALAQSNLGQMYDEGHGVKQNDKEAVKWFRLAAEQGVAQAQFNLGRMFVNGKGVKQDDKKSFHWFRLAADQGLVHAQYKLSIMYTTGKGVEQDHDKAVKWCQKAAAQGHADALLALRAVGC